MIELDRDLARRLRLQTELDVIEADVLTVDFRTLAEKLGAPLRVVGNLPYNISTPILFHLLEVVDAVEDQALHAANAKWSSGWPPYVHQGVRPPQRDAAVALRHRVGADVRRERSSRRPRSSRPSSHVAAAQAATVDAKRLGEIVAVAFSQRRKILRHTLGRYLDERRFGGASTCSGGPRKCRSLIRGPGGSSAARGVRRRRGAGGLTSSAAQAAFNHIAVSKALLINGMFMPKLLFAALLAAA